MYVTPEQETVLAVLKKTGCLTENQALRILRSRYPRMTVPYAQRVLYQLRHINKARLLPDGTIVTFLYGRRDDAMLSAVDVMLDICRGVPTAWAAWRKPFQLTFLTGKKLRQFAVLYVSEGEEARIGAVAEASDVGPHCRVIFILSALEQRKAVSTSLPHYFAFRDKDEGDNGRYRYFKGGDAKCDR